jgi:uncharacterized protein (DUF433 family)
MRPVLSKTPVYSRDIPMPQIMMAMLRCSCNQHRSSGRRQYMGNAILAFTVDQVRKLTGLSARQIRYWDDTCFFSPSHASEKNRPFGRVYSFQDVVWLRVVSMLNRSHNIRLRKLRPVVEWLQSHPSESWSTLTFYVAGGNLYFDDRDLGLRIDTAYLSQAVIPIDMQPINRAVEREENLLRERDADEIDSITRKRSVSHNYPVLAGTRVRTEAVWNFHEAGYSNDEILQQYPRLEPEDITEAIRFERESVSLRNAPVSRMDTISHR